MRDFISLLGNPTFPSIIVGMLLGTALNWSWTTRREVRRLRARLDRIDPPAVADEITGRTPS